MKDALQIFNDSFERCSADARFLDRFYDLFISSSDEVKEHFRDTDIAKQKKMLLRSLSYIMAAHKTPDVLDEIATLHDSRNRNVEPRLYLVWLDCMIEAVKLTDAQFNDEIEGAWRSVMQIGIDYMASKYRDPGA
ncbi:MAG: hypothetical protein N2C14_06675 [Planctomycetales bacterium]